MRGGWEGLLVGFRVDDLKDVCRKAGLQVTGTKSILIQRIKNGIRDDPSSRVSNAVSDVHHLIDARLIHRVERRQLERRVTTNGTIIPRPQNGLGTSSYIHRHSVIHYRGGNIPLSAEYCLDGPMIVSRSDESDESILHRGEKDPFLKILGEVGTIFRLVGGGYGVEVALSIPVILKAEQIANMRKDDTILALRSFKLKPRTKEGLKWDERGHLWPLDTKVFINGKKIEIKQRKILWQGTERKIRGSCSLAEVSKLCKEGVNLVRISCMDIDTYGFVIQTVKKYSIEDVMEDIKKQPDSVDGLQRAIDSFKKVNYGSVEDGDDSAVAATSMRLSLKCPLGLSTIGIPARGAKCAHLQCFDLETFLRYCSNGSESTWRCAVCHTPTDPHEIVVDQFMKNIVDEIKKKIGSEGEGIDEVDIFDDGHWEPVRMQSQRLSTQSRKRKRSQLLTGSVVSQQPLNGSVVAAPSSPSIFTSIPQQLNRPPGPVPATEVVDLSLDTDSPSLAPIPVAAPIPALNESSDQIGFEADNIDYGMEEDLLLALTLFQNG